MLSESFLGFTGSASAARPELAIVLGSGLGELARDVRPQQAIAFCDIPGLSEVTVAGHRGRLILGTWAGKAVLVFEGRLHYYEGHSWDTVVSPVRIAHNLGVRRLLVTNAAGGIHDDLVAGSLMLIRDHMQWTRPWYWRKPGPGGLGPSRASPYSDGFAELVLRAGRDVGIELKQGMYAAVTGPSYETPAEIRALRSLGADAVGMSTAREIQTGHDLGLECAAISCITNRAAGLSSAPLNHHEVLAAAQSQADRFRRLLERLLQP
jgi:purine-nucleoside phosphorylase